MKMFMKGLLSRSDGTCALPAQADTTRTQFRNHIPLKARKIQAGLGAIHCRHVQADRHQGQSVFASDYAGIIEAQNSTRSRWPGTATSRHNGSCDRPKASVRPTVARTALRVITAWLANATNDALNSLDDIKKCDKTCPSGTAIQTPHRASWCRRIRVCCKQD